MKNRIEISKYIDQKKELHENLLSFIENSDNDFDNFPDFQQFLISLDFFKNIEETKHILTLISNIFNNHHRQPGFLQKNFQLLQFLFGEIKQSLSNQELFDIFKNNKLILLFLIENKIITFDESIIKYISFSQEAKKANLFQFFLPELKRIKEEKNEKIINEEDLADMKLDNQYEFENNRKIGENDSYICQLIRDDSVKEFISYVNKKNLSLSNIIIERSIFETNLFLIENNPSLIEYAAFYGSIQIFQYLKLSGVELNESLWLYAIHSKNAELIHLLEENQIKPSDETYEECLLESIKCNHNDIAKYIEDNLLIQNHDNLDKENKLKEKIISACFQYSNYEYFPRELNSNYIFFYLIKYNYFTLVDLYLDMKKSDIDRIKINQIIYFLKIKLLIIKNLMQL